MKFKKQLTKSAYPIESMPRQPIPDIPEVDFVEWVRQSKVGTLPPQLKLQAQIHYLMAVINDLIKQINELKEKLCE